MPRIGTRPQLKTLALGGLAALTLLGTAACGSSGSAGSGARHQAMQAYRQCLTQHGVTLPARQHGAQQAGAPAAGQKHQPGTPPAGVDPQTWTAAQTACASVRPHHGS
jgi:hypothetical protein